MKNLFILFSILFVSLSNAFSADYYVPEKLGISYVGEEFYLTFHPTFRTSADASDVVKLYLSSEFDTKVTVAITNNNYNQTVSLKANKVTTLSIPFDNVLMYVKPKVTTPDDEQIWTKRALIITADDPIICYAMLEGIEKTEGYLALPKQSLGTNYVVASTRNTYSGSGTDQNTSYTSIVAAYNDTKITITLGGEAVNQTPKGIGLNGQIKATLNKGDVYLLPVLGINSDLSGTYISATKPVSVISGNSWTHLPESSSKGNYTIEQEIPIESMSSNYYVFPYSYDKHTLTAKIFSTVDSKTDYYKNGQLEGSMKKLGGQSGDAYNTLKINEYGTACYTATNPIYITQYESSDEMSSPFQMALLSNNQYNKIFRFITPSDCDKTFISVIYRCPEGTYDPIGINLLKIDGNNKESKPLTEYSKIEDLLIKANDNGEDVRVRTAEVTGTTLYEIQAGYPIAAYLYGYKSQRAFGYPAGTYLSQPKYILDTLAPIITAGGLSGNKINGTVIEDDNMDYSSISGLGEPIFMNTYSSNVKFTIDDFSPGTASLVKWTLEITDLKKVAKAVVVFTDKAGNQSLYDYKYVPTDNDAPTVTHSINRFGKITATATDEPKEDDAIRVGLQSIELGAQSVNYSLNISTFTAGLNEYQFTAVPIDPSKYGKAVLVIKDKNGNQAGFTYEYNPDNVPPICNWSKPDQFTITGKVIDMPDNDSTRINLDTLIVTESNNVEVTVKPHAPNPREIDFTLKQIDHAQAGSVTIFAKDKYGNDSTFSFTFEPSGGVETKNMNNFVLSPNPADRYLMITTKGELINQIQIFNSLGVLVSASNYTEKIDVSNLPNGMYYCILYIGSDRVNRQFIILR